MNNYKVHSRAETCKLIESSIQNGDRLVVSRYSDGEVNIMSGIDARPSLATGNENPKFLANKLINAIATKGQLVCINELKAKNIARNDKWVGVQRFLANAGKRNTYGAANWNIYDFQNGSKILSHLFSGKLLVITGYDMIKGVLKRYRSHFDIYKTPLKEMSARFDEHAMAINKMAKNNYDNILFCCGPSGKIILSKLIGVCESNLVDLGSVINAIITGLGKADITKRWNMSWVSNVDLNKCAMQFVKGLKNV